MGPNVARFHGKVGLLATVRKDGQREGAELKPLGQEGYVPLTQLLHRRGEGELLDVNKDLETKIRDNLNLSTQKKKRKELFA